MDRFRERADKLLIKAEGAIADRCNAMHAEHSAKGLLGSGATVKVAIRIFGQATSEALGQITSEASKAIEHRGRAWSKAMQQIGLSLEAHISKAPDLLANSFRLANLPTGGEAAAMERLEKSAAALRDQLAEFRDGWTAPVPKRWTERHPVAYAAALLLCGAVFGAGATKLVDALSTLYMSD